MQIPMTTTSGNVMNRGSREQAAWRAVLASGQPTASARRGRPRRTVERWLIQLLVVVLVGLGLSALALCGLALTSARTTPLEEPALHHAIGQCLAEACGADQTGNQP